MDYSFGAIQNPSKLNSLLYKCSINSEALWHIGMYANPSIFYYISVGFIFERLFWEFLSSHQPTALKTQPTLLMKKWINFLSQKLF